MLTCCPAKIHEECESHMRLQNSGMAAGLSRDALLGEVIFVGCVRMPGIVEVTGRTEFSPGQTLRGA
jgi:hypothetical protein